MWYSDNGLVCFVLLGFVWVFLSAYTSITYLYTFLYFFLLFYNLLSFLFLAEGRETHFFQAVQFACISFLLTDVHEQA